MVDDVNNITETVESKAASEALDRARLARERREAEQRKRLEELRAHAAAAQAQREKRDDDRRRRQAEQRARDDDRRQQVEDRKRAIWEASVSRREALLQREKDRSQRLERARAARSSPRPAFAFGSSTPRLLEPLDNAGFFWAARSTNPLDQMNFFESLAASTSNVMFASAPLMRRASALQLDSDTDNKDESDRSPAPVVWSSVARRRTDLVPTLPTGGSGSRAPDPVSGETTPGSRPGSAMSTAGTHSAVVRRAAPAPRRPRPASIAGTGVNTPRGGGDSGTAASTPTVSRDGSVVATTPGVSGGAVGGGGDTPRRAHTTPRRPRPSSLHVAKPSATPSPADGKPPLHRKPKSAKDHDKWKTPPPATDKRQVSAAAVSQKLEALRAGDAARDVPTSQNQEIENKENIEVNKQVYDNNLVTDQVKVDTLIELEKPIESATDVPTLDGIKQTENDKNNKNEQLNEVENNETEITHIVEKVETLVLNPKEEKEIDVSKQIEKVDIEVSQFVEKKEEKQEEKNSEKRDEKKESSQEKTEENEMTASMTARRITTEQQAKAALAERRRRAREELERQAELERQRLQREAEEEAERQRVEEERQRREEEEARALAAEQRRATEEKLQKAIEAQQQLEREEAERRAREEAEREARVREEAERRAAAEAAERARRLEAEREERERVARKQRVEAIMARTRHKKQAEEEKKSQENKQENSEQSVTSPAAGDNGNALRTAQVEESKHEETVHVETISDAVNSSDTKTSPATNNGNVTADLLGLSEQHISQDTTREQSPITTNKLTETANSPAPTLEANNGNVQSAPTPNIGHISTNIGHISANFIQTERISAESNQKTEVAKIIEDDFTTHNGHGNHNNHPLTLQNAI